MKSNFIKFSEVHCESSISLEDSTMICMNSILFFFEVVHLNIIILRNCCDKLRLEELIPSVHHLFPVLIKAND